jgi:hypothetical protein
VGLGVAAVLAVAAALAQVIDYQFFDLRFRALDSNTHMSVFGAASLLANAVVVALAISLAARARNRELVILSVVLSAMFALRVAHPNHVLLLSLPLTGIALVILWRQGPSAGDGLWTIRIGCSLLVVSFAVHALELEPPPGLPAGVLAAFVGGRPGGGAIISGSHAEAIANADLPTDTWTYLAVTYDGAALRFYVNAKPVSTTGRTGSIATSTNPLTIGSDPFYGQYFTGLIDEIRVYDSALDMSEIRGDMTTPVAARPGTESLVTATSSPTPVAAFEFDEDSGRAVADASGSGNNGTAAHTTWTPAGKYGGALSFNGTSSRVTIPESVSLRLTRAMTLEAWVNPATVSNTWRDVIMKGNDNYYLAGTSISESWASQVRSLTKHEAELVAWILIAAGLLNLRSSNQRRRPEETGTPLGSHG